MLSISISYWGFKKCLHLWIRLKEGIEVERRPKDRVKRGSLYGNSILLTIYVTFFLSNWLIWNIGIQRASIAPGVTVNVSGEFEIFVTPLLMRSAKVPATVGANVRFCNPWLVAGVVLMTIFIAGPPRAETICVLNRKVCGTTLL